MAGKCCAYLVEFIGTVAFVLVILLTNGNAVAIGLMLLLLIALFGSLSGGHFNPAVSFATYLRNGLTLRNLLAYVSVQLLAGAVAVYLFKWSLVAL